LDDPLQPANNDRTPLTGNIGSRSSNPRSANTQSYLNSAISGEDRHAPTNTIDEAVWETLSRDLKAVWEKIRLVLWPRYLLGGMLTRRGEGIGGEAERGEASATRGLLGRWPDADDVLQANMSEGLRDWDLWYVSRLLYTIAY
jgi:protein YIPF6